MRFLFVLFAICLASPVEAKTWCDGKEWVRLFDEAVPDLTRAIAQVETVPRP
jgi:hypothetical protein